MLEWEDENFKSEAETILGFYSVVHVGHERFRAKFRGDLLDYFPTLDEAKAACEAHYLSTLKQAVEQAGYVMVKVDEGENRVRFGESGIGYGELK